MTAETRRCLPRRLAMVATAGVCWVAIAVGPQPRARRGEQAVSVAGPVRQPIWSVAGAGRGTPAADAQTAYFLSKYHEVVAIELASGKERWRASTLGTGEESQGARVVLAGRVIVAGDYGVVGFERRTGAILWRFAPETGYGAGLFVGQAVGPDVFTGSADGYVHAIETRTGRAHWSVEIARDGRATTVFGPIVSGGLVIAGYTEFSRPARGGLVALEAATGRERWRRAFPAWVTRSASTGAAGEPIAAGQQVVAASQDGTIFGLERETGAVRWVIPAGNRPDGRGPIVQDYRPLALVGGMLVAGSLTGAVVGYDLESRQERWRRAPIAASVAFGLEADEQTVYVPYISGHLVALDAESGEERWRAGGPAMGLAWPPALAAGRLVTAGSRAGFLAFAR